MTPHTIGFIGAGNMARSLAGGLLNNGWTADRRVFHICVNRVVYT